jgi:hypothetical protein
MNKGLLDDLDIEDDDDDDEPSNIFIGDRVKYQGQVWEVVDITKNRFGLWIALIYNSSTGEQRRVNAHNLFPLLAGHGDLPEDRERPAKREGIFNPKHFVGDSVMNPNFGRESF